MTTRTTKFAILYWNSIIAALASVSWVLSLVALVARAKLDDLPFPALAKMTPFCAHLDVTDILGRASPAFALLACILGVFAWRYQRSFRAVRPLFITITACVIVSVLVLAGDPGGYFSWFLS